MGSADYSPCVRDDVCDDGDAHVCAEGERISFRTGQKLTATSLSFNLPCACDRVCVCGPLLEEGKKRINFVSGMLKLA